MEVEVVWRKEGGRKMLPGEGMGKAATFLVYKKNMVQLQSASQIEITFLFLEVELK